MNILITEPQFYPETYKPLIPKNWKINYENFVSNGEFYSHLKIKKYEIIFLKLGLSMNTEKLNLQPELKILVTPTTGLDHIDQNYAKNKNIKIISLTNETKFLQGITSTAEHAWMLTLSLQRQLFDATNIVKQNHWSRNKFKIFQLKDKTLGIIGFGRLGQMISKYGKAFQMKIIANDILKKKETRDVKFVSLNEIFSLSDVIIIVANYKKGMKPILSKKNQLKLIKNKPIIINVSRGGLIDENTIIEALDKNIIKGYGCDVISDDSNWDEKKNIQNKLIDKFKHDTKLIITPHVGGFSQDAIFSTRKFVLMKTIEYYKKLKN